MKDRSVLRRILTVLVVLAGLPATASAVAPERSGYVMVDPPDDLGVAASESTGEPIVLYLNRDGGTFRPGGEDARQNMSAIVDEVSTIPRWNAPDAGWQQVVSCMTDMMSRWNVRITDQDPGNVPHYELVIAGRPENIGMPSNYGGVAPFSSQCNVIPNAIVYTFAELFGTNYRGVCEVSAQEIAHAFGLDHEYLCEDPMSYLRGCGPKSFQQREAQCGEYEARECACGGETQNSVAMLDARMGLAGQGNPAPDVAIMSPSDGARVPPGFTVTADVYDNSGVMRVDLVIDGQIVATAEGAPYEFATPTDLAEGEHTIEIVAVDEGRATGSTSIAVTVAKGASLDDSDDGVGGDDGATPAGCSAAGGTTGLATALLILAVFGLRRALGRR